MQSSKLQNIFFSRKIRIFVSLLILIFLLFEVVAFLFRYHIRTLNQTALSEAPFDAIIVPGIPYDSAGPNFIFRVRMNWAKDLMDRSLTRHIIFSGAAVHTPYVEGQIMKEIADSMGIPQSKTFAETNALHGDENVLFGLKLADSLGFSKVAVASDPFQVMYLRYRAHLHDRITTFLPIKVEDISQYDIQLPAVKESYHKLKNFVPLRNR